MRRSSVSRSQVSASLTSPAFQELRHRINPKARPHTASAKRTVYRPVKMRGADGSGAIDLSGDLVSARSGRVRSAGEPGQAPGVRPLQVVRPYSASTRRPDGLTPRDIRQSRGLSLGASHAPAYMTELRDSSGTSSSEEAASEAACAPPARGLSARSAGAPADPSLVFESPLRLPPSAAGVDPAVIRGEVAMQRSLKQELRSSPRIPSTPDRFGADPLGLKAPPPVPCLAGHVAFKPEAVRALSRSGRPRSCAVGKTRPSRTLNSEVGQRLRLPSAVKKDAVRDVRSISCLSDQQ